MLYLILFILLVFAPLLFVYDSFWFLIKFVEAGLAKFLATVESWNGSLNIASLAAVD